LKVAELKQYLDRLANEGKDEWPVRLLAKDGQTQECGVAEAQLSESVWVFSL
jgi:hypothetical protein